MDADENAQAVPNSTTPVRFSDVMLKPPRNPVVGIVGLPVPETVASRLQDKAPLLPDVVTTQIIWLSPKNAAPEDD